jgi:hypothetical protein
VRAAAVDALCTLLAMVRAVPLADAHIFPEYLLPALTRLAADSQELVRVAFAGCIASLADSSRRFLGEARSRRLVRLMSAQKSRTTCSNSLTARTPTGA